MLLYTGFYGASDAPPYVKDVEMFYYGPTDPPLYDSKLGGSKVTLKKGMFQSCICRCVISSLLGSCAVPFCISYCIQTCRCCISHIHTFFLHHVPMFSHTTINTFLVTGNKGIALDVRSNIHMLIKVHSIETRTFLSSIHVHLLELLKIAHEKSSTHNIGDTIPAGSWVGCSYKYGDREDDAEYTSAKDGVRSSLQC